MLDLMEQQTISARWPLRLWLAVVFFAGFYDWSVFTQLGSRSNPWVVLLCFYLVGGMGSQTSRTAATLTPHGHWRERDARNLAPRSHVLGKQQGARGGDALLATRLGRTRQLQLALGKLDQHVSEGDPAQGAPELDGGNLP